MKKTNLIISITVIILGAVGAFAVMNNSKPQNNHESYVKIDGNHVDVDLAVTPSEKSRGLGGRESMPENKGMLFIFNEVGPRTFWMLNMNFGLDFIWIDENTIVDVHKNIPPPEPGEDLERYSPMFPADKVLEVNAGWIERNFGDEDIIGKEVDIFVE